MSMRVIYNCKCVIKMLPDKSDVQETYSLLFKLVLLLCILQKHVGLREFGVQQLFLQVSVLEDLFQVLEDIQVNL